MAKQAQIQSAPPSQGITPRVDFRQGSFEELLWEKGYPVLWERALPCPCVENTASKSGCKNCQGTGWIFINPQDIRCVMTSINRSTKYKEWGQELLGTVSVTCESRFSLSYMDRLTIKDTVVNNSEVLKIRKITVNGENITYCFSTFRIQEIREIFLFIDINTKLTLLNEDDYEFEENKIVFAQGVVSEGDYVTINYKYNPEYHILDFQHDIRNSIAVFDKEEKQLILPISAIARRAMNVSFDRQNYDGTSVIDNSYVLT
jgi:hypothetical protein